MEHLHLDLQQAIDKAGEIFREKTETFNTLYKKVPRWVGPIDLDVQKVVDGFAQHVSGVLHWSYESQRYFGTRGLEIKKTRVVELLPESDDVERRAFMPAVRNLNPQGTAV